MEEILKRGRYFSAGFRRGLSETGHVEGRTTVVEYRWAEGVIARVPDFLADLADRQPAVIFAGGSDALVLAAKAAITTIPIIFAVGGDPVEYGLVKSLNSADWQCDRGHNNHCCSLAKAAGAAAGAGALSQDDRCARQSEPSECRRRHASGARCCSCNRGTSFILNVSTERDIDAAFATLAREKVGGLLVANDPLFTGHRRQLVAQRRGMRYRQFMIDQSSLKSEG